MTSSDTKQQQDVRASLPTLPVLQILQVDLTGGYYDAGDNVKFNWPLAHTVTMLSWGAIEYGDQLAEAGELQHVREAIKWATDFLLKAAVGPTKLYTQVYQRLGYECQQK